MTSPCASFIRHLHRVLVVDTNVATVEKSSVSSIAIYRDEHGHCAAGVFRDQERLSGEYQLKPWPGDDPAAQGEWFSGLAGTLEGALNSDESSELLEVHGPADGSTDYGIMGTFGELFRLVPWEGPNRELVTGLWGRRWAMADKPSAD